MIPEPTIFRLIEAGRSKIQNAQAWCESYADLAAQDELNRLHWKSWDEAVESLTDDELVALIQGLALCERNFRWSGGSVSAVIWTFRALTRRQSKTDELAEWLLRTSDNPWVPFGSNRGNASSLEEIQRGNEARSARRAATESSECDRKEQAALSRKARRDEHITLQAEHRIRWESMVRELEPLSARDRLHRLLATEDGVALSSFPEQWAAATGFEVIEQLSANEISALQMKLASVQRGEWKSLRRRLESLARSQESAQAGERGHYK